MATTNVATTHQHGFVNTILHGNCIELMRQMPPASVDFILSDPPYLVNYRDRSHRSILNDAADSWLKPAMAESYRLLKQDRVSAIKVPVHEEPNQIINDGEKRGWVDRAEPHRIRINGSAGPDQCLAQARNKLRARRRSLSCYRMKCRSLKAQRAADDKSAMLWVCYHC